MRVGVNLLYLEPGGTGGTETYARGLLPALEELGVELSVFAGHRGWEMVAAGLAKTRWVQAPRVPAGRALRVLIEQTWLAAVAGRAGLDLLFSPGYVAPVLSRAALVTTVPDTLYAEQPDALPMGKRLYWRVFIPLTVARSRRVLTISEFSAGCLRARFPRHAAKIRLTHLASPFAEEVPTGVFPGLEVTPTGSGAVGYFLTVAQHLPHKNIEGVLRATARLRSRGAPVRLVVVGPRGPATPALRQLGQALGGEAWVEWREGVPSDGLQALYRGALALVLASRFEGFGLPVVEAMGLGCPVLCSEIPPLVEIAGGAARHFAPDDVEALAALMDEMLRAPEARAALARRGRERARTFTWRRCAEATVRVFEEACR